MPEVSSFLKPVFEHPAYRAARDALAEGGAAVLSGLTRTAKALVLAGLAHDTARPVVVLTSDNEAAQQAVEVASTFLAWLEGGAARAAVSTLPAFDCTPYDGRSPHAGISERRAVTLWSIARGSIRVLFVPLAAALGRFRESSYYRSLALELEAGDELDPNDLVEHLTGVGYEASEPVSNAGQFSLRGGILDVFSPASDPYRIEFFGDRIETLREFDVRTQRSRKSARQALILPLSETKRSPQLFDRILQHLIQQSPKRRRPDEAAEWAPAYSGAFPGWEFFVPLVESRPYTLLSLFDRPALVWDEPAERIQQLRRMLETWAGKFDEVRDWLPPRPQPHELLLNQQEFLKSFSGPPSLFVKELAIQGSAAEGTRPPPEGTAQSDPVLFKIPPREFTLSSQPAPKFHGAISALVEEVRRRIECRQRVGIALPTTGKMERLREILAEYQLPFESAQEDTTGGPGDPAPTALPGEPEQARSKKPVLLMRGELVEGVGFPDVHLLLHSDSDLFGGFVWAARKERSIVSSFLSDLSDLRAGDYVVHVDHGIGLYQGMRQIEVSGKLHDFMLLTYQDDAKLYLPLERLDLAEKYRPSGDAAKPALDKLGGTTWARTKTRVQRALRDMAQELLGLYAERKMHERAGASPDSPWQKEFEEGFEFEETPDQIKAMGEIKRDLESPQPMDRLLAGDVGYGKTELAMRAAFKVVQDGKQAAVLAPTTVLVFQHFNTFRQRLAAFPVRVEMLSRFRSASEQKKILAATEAGRVDILVGTHRMLSRDVRFRNLGLLIVDEEQRFGVAAKEKLKKLRANLDVLTMSATPIPRTLHMSIGGLRDLSVIETPPLGRLAIQTVVAGFSDALVQAALLREIERQGQVFFVHNRVQSIFSMAALLQRLVPTARIGVAHGQMSEKELERVMLKFIEGKYDVLASTALIENGLDFPRANTILVNHAERFGLADLYQLRGRVGRSDREAYAYFLVGAEEALTPTAKRRLAALREFSDLGSGFRLAALDLELRGAGNLLGAEQSGHLNAVGIDLYLQMLEETVQELRGTPATPKVRATLNLGLDIKIPAGYIADESQRLRMYKRISGIRSPEERAELETELLDRYGALPRSVENLLSYAQLKSKAEDLLVESVERKAEEIWVRFHEQAPVSAEKLTRFLRGYCGATFRPDGTLRFRLAAPESEIPERVRNALQELRA